MGEDRISSRRKLHACEMLRQIIDASHLEAGDIVAPVG
jgi:hypothetical protein